MSEVTKAFATPDGKIFATMAEATEYMRRPKVVEALKKIVDDNDELVDWIADNREEIAAAFDAGKVKRVSKSEKNQLEKALKAIVEANEPKFKFVVDNHAAIADSFRWPKVTRMDDAEKEAAIKAALTELAGENEEIADFIISSKEQLLEAFSAGKVKREINPKAREGLARYQEEQKRLKAEREAAEAKSAKK